MFKLQKSYKTFYYSLFTSIPNSILPQTVAKIIPTDFLLEDRSGAEKLHDTLL